MKPGENPRTSTLTFLISSDPGTLGSLQKPFELGCSQQKGLASSCKLIFITHRRGKNQWTNLQDMLKKEKRDSEGEVICVGRVFISGREFFVLQLNSKHLFGMDSTEDWPASLTSLETSSGHLVCWCKCKKEGFHTGVLQPVHHGLVLHIWSLCRENIDDD